MRLLGILTFSLLSIAATQAEDWTRFRGNDGQGHAQSSAPTQWSADSVAWKLELPGPGSSSPIVVGDKVFVTSYSGDASSDSKRHLICVDANSGKQLWERSVSGPDREDAYRGYITEHGYASATPVSNGKHVFAFFGKAGVVAYTLDGEKLWQKDVGQMSANRRWGSAASPVLYNDTLIVNAAEEARAIIGLNIADGKELWKAESGGLELCYATPVLVEGEGGKTEAVISMPGEVWGLNPESGKLRWYCLTETPGNVSPSVVVSDDTLFTFGGYPGQQTNAIKRKGRKDITDSHRLWQSRDSSYVATPLYHDGHLYWVNDKGVALSANAKTGETITQERLSGVRGGGRPFYASPVKVGNKIVVVSRRSGTYVFNADPDMEQVTKNEALDESDFNATPAAVNGKLYLRSNEALYCIGD